MAGLAGFVEGFLSADGYDIANNSPGRILATRPTPGGGREQRIVWYVDPDNGMALDESRLLAAFAAPRDARTQAFFLTPTLAGLSTAFRQKARELDVAVRVPIQFFDTPYKVDGDAAFGSGGGDNARSAFVEFIEDNRAAVAARIAQPYVSLSSRENYKGGFASGPDLLGPLASELSAAPDAPSITIIIGNAGAGKSVLFAALFDALARHFADEKRAQRLASRPILFLPSHIRAEERNSLDGLLGAVAQTDAAAPTGPALMRWLNDNGLTIWLFDGLDEFFAGEPEFVAALEAGLSGGGRSRVVICARDSLLTSSTALQALVDRHMASGRIKLFELSRWERASQRALAFQRLEQRTPAPQEPDTPKVAAFLELLDGSDVLSELATLPYYCNLLLDQPLARSARPSDEFELMAAAVDGLIDRESEKLATGETGFDWDVFSGADTFVDATEIVAAHGVDAFNSADRRAQIVEALRVIGRERLVELIEGIAHRMRMLEAYPNEGQGLSIKDIEQLSQFYLDVGLLPDLEPRVVLAMVQLAFFGRGQTKGFVRFSREIVADFLAARHALATIQARPESADALGQALGVRKDLDRTIILRFLAREIGRDPELAATVIAHADSGRVRAAHAANAAVLARALEGRRG